MNATFTARFAAVLCCLAGTLPFAPARAKPAASKPVAPRLAASKPAVPKPAAPKPAAPKPAPVTAAPSAAVAVVRQYLDARDAGQADRACALLSSGTQARFPAAQRAQVSKDLADSRMPEDLPPSALPVLALFVDMQDTLHFKFRVLGPSPDDPAAVLVRAYQVGTPLSTIRTLQIVTAADADAGGALRLDGEETLLRAAPEMKPLRESARRASSQSNLKQLSLGILQYAQDNDMKLPDADKWVDEVLPYVKNEAVFRDPAAPGLPYGYAFNRALSGVPLASLESPATTVLLFESSAGKKNAADTGGSIPLPGRHSEGTDYAMADGHAQWEADGTRPSFLTTGK